MATGGLVWGTSLVLASVDAVRTRVPGDRWSGAQSTLADNVRLTGWWYLDEASEVLGGSPGRVRGWLRASVIVCVVAFVSTRSEEHTSELQSLMRISYAVFCLKKKQNQQSISIYYIIR